MSRRFTAQCQPDRPGSNECTEDQERQGRATAGDGPNGEGRRNDHSSDYHEEQFGRHHTSFVVLHSHLYGSAFG